MGVVESRGHAFFILSVSYVILEMFESLSRSVIAERRVLPCSTLKRKTNIFHSHFFFLQRWINPPPCPPGIPSSLLHLDLAIAPTSSLFSQSTNSQLPAFKGAPMPPPSPTPRSTLLTSATTRNLSSFYKTGAYHTCAPSGPDLFSRSLQTRRLGQAAHFDRPSHQTSLSRNPPVIFRVIYTKLAPTQRRPRKQASKHLPCRRPIKPTGRGHPNLRPIDRSYCIDR